jgi:septum site-determining protein MinC
MHAQAESEAAATRSSRESGRSKNQAFELKGMVAPLTVLLLRTADMAVIAKQLRSKVAQMPQFFQDAPVLVDLAALGEDADRLPFGELAAVLRCSKMVPVAITNAEGDARARAAAVGFGYVAPPTPRAGGRATEISRSAPALEAPARMSAPSPEAAPVQGEAAPARMVAPLPEAVPIRGEAAPVPVAQPVRAAHRPPMIIRQPVRSGQVIYAEGADLVLLAPVNSGAEVIADGHVHIYSALRGRAVAGAQGMTDARIFCQKLDAELVGISGAYLLSDDLSAQIYLEDGVCRVTVL